MQALGDRLTYFELLAIIWCHFSQIILHRVKERKKKKEGFFHARRKNLDQCHFKLYPLLCAINCVRFSFGSNICCKTVMPGHEVFRIRESFDTLIPDERIRNANQTKSDNLVVNQIITVFMFSC